MWKKILYTILLSSIFIASAASADYKFNPFTGKLDRTMNGEAITNTSSTATTSTVTGGFFQTGLTDCDLDTQGLNYDLGLGKFICGDDDTGAGGSANDWGRFGTTYNTLSLRTSTTYPVWIDGALFVSSTAIYSSGLRVDGALNASSTLLVANLSTLFGGFISNASSSISAGLQVSGALNASSTLLVNSLSTLSGGFLATGSSTVTGAFYVSGVSKLIGLVFASSSIQIGGSVNAAVSSTIIDNGTLQIGTNTTSHRTGVLWVDATTGNNGNTSVSGTLQLFGLLTARAGFISMASSSISAGLQVAGSLNASSTLNVNGLAVFSSLSTLTGFISTASSSVSAGLQVAGALNASSTLHVAGLSFHTGLATFTGGFISNASSSIGAGLQVSGALNASSSLFLATSLFVNQGAGFNSGRFTVDSSGNISASGTAQLYGYDRYVLINYSTSTWVGTTTPPILLGPADKTETWLRIECETNAGTVNVSIYDGTNRMDMLVASTTIGVFKFSTNNVFNPQESRRVEIGTPVSSPTIVSCKAVYRETY